MQSFQYEWKKIMYYQKGLLFLILLLAGRFVFLALTDEPANVDMEQNKSDYLYYLNQVEGKLTKQKAALLEQESENISEAASEFQTQYDTIDNDTQEEWQKKANETAKVLEHESGFDIIYEQYNYIQEDSKNRYFLYTNGWNGLLKNDSLDWFVMLLITVLAVPAFCQEAVCKMDMLIASARRGSRENAIRKIQVISILTLAVSLAASLLEYLFYALKYGLPHGEYPIQSLQFYGTGTRTISLLQSFLFVTASKMFGYLCYAWLILLLASLIQKYVTTAFLSMLFIIVPYFIGKTASWKYHIPGPLGFMIASGFLRGTEAEETDEKQIIFQAVEGKQYLLILFVTLLFSILCYWLILKKHTNYWWKTGQHKKRFRMGKLKLFCFLLGVSALMITGCGNENKKEQAVTYNRSGANLYETTDYLVYSKMDDGKTKIICEDKESGDEKELVREPLDQYMELKSMLYCSGPYVYYVKYDNDAAGYFGCTDKISFMRVDTRDLSEKILYEVNVNTQKTSMIGLESEKQETLAYFDQAVSFFVKGDNIYLIFDNEITCLNCKTGRKHVVLQSPNLESVSYDGSHIFYLDTLSNIVCYDIETGQKETLQDVAAKSFILEDGKLYFINLKDHRKLYVYDSKESLIKKIADESVLSFSCDNKYVFYESEKDLYQYRLNLDGNDKRLVTKQKGLISYTSAQCRNLILYDFSDDSIKLTQIDKDTLETVS